MNENNSTKIITITHGNGAVQTMEVPFDFDESSINPIDQEQLDTYFLEMQVKDALKYLADTDWYVSRKAETNVDIPEEVLQKRQEAREFISANRTGE